MVNKKSVWFLTLFSLVLVLSVYYITMPDDLLLTNVSNAETDSTTSGIEDTEQGVVTISESTVLVALRASEEEEYLTEMESLKSVLNNTKSTVDEKNNAYEQIKSLSNLKSEQEAIEKQIKDEYNLTSFVKIDSNQVRVVIDSDKHDTTIANNIMRLVQSNYKNKMYVSVKFQTSA